MDPKRSSSRTVLRETIQHELYVAVMRRHWDKVVEIYKEYPGVQATMIADADGTALHSAITHGAPEITVAKLVDEIEMTDNAMMTLAARNKRRDTPLHCAASRGSTTMCHRMLRVDESLVCERNIEGETPLFLAALNGHKQTFFYLHTVCPKMDTGSSSTLWKRNNGDTILHCTIRRKYFDISYQIIQLYKDQNIGCSFNEEGDLPLNDLVSIPSAFKSGTHLTWWQKLRYNYICVEKLKYEPQGKSHPIDVQDSSDSDGYQTQRLKADFDRPPGYIRKIKEKHVWAAQIMEELVKQDPWYKENNDAKEMQKMMSMKNCEPYYHLRDEEIRKGRIKKSTALLIAAKNGLIEQVNKILNDIPTSIYNETTVEKKNIIHVAVEERQSDVLEAVMKHPLWYVLREKVDAHGNNALHLAAQLSKHTTWEIHGSIMQMQWEVKWFEYVKEKMPSYFGSQTNAKGETPGEIFADQHKVLVHECNDWVKDTSGSYIVASTLIAGVTFSTLYQAPLNCDDKTGNPIIGVRPTFHIFSISVLISFCFSITSLAVFLAIFSSRKERPKGFRRNLPLKLLLGLSSFFVAVVSMLVSFCAAHSSHLHPREYYKHILLYSFILIPALWFYAATQIPLYKDLLKASIKKVPKPRCVEEEEDYIGT